MDENENKVSENPVKISIEKQEFKCEICPAICKSERSYRDHQRRVHDCKRYICEVCSTEITGLLNFKNHARKHDQEDCPKCSKTILRYSFPKHIRNCTGSKVKEKKPRKMFPCDLCPHEAQSQERLETHKKKHDKIIIKTPFKCSHEDCSYATFDKSNINRHESEYCVFLKRARGPLNGPVTERELNSLFADCEVSIADFNKILDFFLKKFGPEWFPKTSKTCVREFCEEMGEFSSHETVEFLDSSGKPIQRTLSYVSDLEGFVSKILEKRQTQDPKLVLGADVGKDQLLMTLSVFDDSNLFEEVGGVKQSSAQAAFLLASVDLVPERLVLHYFLTFNIPYACQI